MDDTKFHVARAAGIDSLISLADAGTGREREKAAHALCRLAVDEEACAKILVAGGHNTFIRLANSGKLTAPMEIAKRLSDASDAAAAAQKAAAAKAATAKAKAEAATTETTKATAAAAAAAEEEATALRVQVPRLPHQRSHDMTQQNVAARAHVQRLTPTFILASASWLLLACLLAYLLDRHPL